MHGRVVLLLAVLLSATLLSGCTGLFGGPDDVTAGQALHNAAIGRRTDLAPVLGVLMLDYPHRTRADMDRFHGLTNAMAGSDVLGDGHHGRWIAVGLRDDPEQYDLFLVGEYLRSYTRGSTHSIPWFLWHVMGAHPIEPNTGWMDSDAAAIRAARLEPDWRSHSDNRSANALMLLHHPTTTQNPVWTFEMTPRSGDPIRLVLDAVTGDRLAPEDVYVPGAPVFTHENVSTMENNGFTLRRDFVHDEPGTDVLTVRLQPTEDPQPGTRVTATLQDQRGEVFPFPDDWPDPIQLRIDAPVVGTYTIEMRPETGGQAGGIPAALAFGVEEIHITRCVLSVRPDPLSIAPTDACDA